MAKGKALNHALDDASRCPFYTTNFTLLKSGVRFASLTTSIGVIAKEANGFSRKRDIKDNQILKITRYTNKGLGR
jgi:hypothetical protein